MKDKTMRYNNYKEYNNTNDLSSIKNECNDCDCYDPDMGCTMPSFDKSYACPLLYKNKK